MAARESPLIRSDQLRRMILGLSLAAATLACPSMKGQNCADITKFGIFDVSRTSNESDMVQDLLKSLSVNETSNQSDAKDASLKVGFTLPDIPVPIQTDGTYGEKHSSSWTKAAIDYLKTHSETHSKAFAEFSTANSAIVAAWKSCVINAKGLICWGTQTGNKNEVLLSIEVRPVSLPLGALRITGITNSRNLTPSEQPVGKILNIQPIPILFTRTGPTQGEAGNFTVRTNSSQYACSADVPALPAPPPPPISLSKPEHCTDWDSATSTCRKCEFKVNLDQLTRTGDVNRVWNDTFACPYMRKGTVDALFNGTFQSTGDPLVAYPDNTILKVGLHQKGTPCSGDCPASDSFVHERVYHPLSISATDTVPASGYSEWEFVLEQCQVSNNPFGSCLTSGANLVIKVAQ